MSRRPRRAYRIVYVPTPDRVDPPGEDQWSLTLASPLPSLRGCHVCGGWHRDGSACEPMPAIDEATWRDLGRPRDPDEACWGV